MSRGGVLILATDTLPGFHCRADCQEAIQRIVSLKGRNQGKPLLLLAGSLKQVQSLAIGCTAEHLAICHRCWPGPFSLILPLNDPTSSSLDPRVSGGTSTVAIRVPQEPALRQLILDVGFPLVSTSVNRQGQPPVVTLAAAWQKFGSQVDGLWQPADPMLRREEGSRASALIDLSGSVVRVLREGPLPFPGSGAAPAGAN